MRGRLNFLKVHETRASEVRREPRTCLPWRRWRDCGGGRIDPVDRVWTLQDRRGARTQGVEPGRGRAAPFRAADRVVESLARDLRAPLQPGRSPMAEQVTPPPPPIPSIEA